MNVQGLARRQDDDEHHFVRECPANEDVEAAQAEFALRPRTAATSQLNGVVTALEFLAHLFDSMRVPPKEEIGGNGGSQHRDEQCNVGLVEDQVKARAASCG